MILYKGDYVAKEVPMADYSCIVNFYRVLIEFNLESKKYEEDDFDDLIDNGYLEEIDFNTAYVNEYGWW